MRSGIWGNRRLHVCIALEKLEHSWRIRIRNNGKWSFSAFSIVACYTLDVCIYIGNDSQQPCSDGGNELATSESFWSVVLVGKLTTRTMEGLERNSPTLGLLVCSPVKVKA